MANVIPATFVRAPKAGGKTKSNDPRKFQHGGRDYMVKVSPDGRPSGVTWYGEYTRSLTTEDVANIGSADFFKAFVGAMEKTAEAVKAGTLTRTKVQPQAKDGLAWEFVG